jgi:hypothetical protein
MSDSNDLAGKVLKCCRAITDGTGKWVLLICLALLIFQWTRYQLIPFLVSYTNTEIGQEQLSNVTQLQQKQRCKLFSSVSQGGDTVDGGGDCSH